MKMPNSQKTLVIAYMMSNGSITPLEAYNKFGILRLAAVICDLRKEGYSIKTTTIVSKNRYGREVRYAKYSFEEEK